MINRQRLWALRLVLEASQHRFAYFITLTYNEEHLPEDRSLDPKALRLFLGRLRSRIAPQRMRFFAVGEYGRRGGRPHYHAALFCGVPPEALRPSVEQAWTKKGSPIGFVHFGALTHDSALYVAKYVCKPKGQIPQGVLPEFARMSLRPYGIGGGTSGYIARVAKAGRVDGVPSALRVDGRLLPIGRYLRSRVAADLGLVKSTIRNRRNDPLSVELLVRQMQLREPGALELREQKRAYSALVAEQRYRRKTYREIL